MNELSPYDICVICMTSSPREFSWSYPLFVQESAFLCALCKGKLGDLGGNRCCFCDRDLSRLEMKYVQTGQCSDCVRWESTAYGGMLERNWSLYPYDAYMKELLALFKYRGDVKIAEAFGSGIAKLSKVVPHDLIVPIPLSGERLMERGFNQSEMLLQAAGLTGCGLLERGHSEKQSKKDRAGRLKHEQVFRCVDQAKTEGKHILLMDDIYTTGATLRKAASALKEAGAARVFSITVAR